MTTRWDMVQAGRDACEQDVRYIYGAKPVDREFVAYSLSEIQALRSIYGTGCVWLTDDAKAGHLCCDCSGLIAKATGIVRGSAQYRAQAVAVHTLGQLVADWQSHIGWALYMPGHIGIVSDVEGYYYAMDGSARNAVHYPLSMQSWESCIQIRDVDYSDGVAQTKGETMEFLYQPNGESRIDWYDGQTIHSLHHPDEMAAIQMAYRMATGEEIPVFALGSESAPWASRFAAAVHRGEDDLAQTYDDNAHADFATVINALNAMAN